MRRAQTSLFVLVRTAAAIAVVATVLIRAVPVLSQNRTVEPPAIQLRTVQLGSTLDIAVPTNWRTLTDAAGNFVFAPENGFLQRPDKSIEFTFGIELMIIQGTRGDLSANTDVFVQNLAGANPRLQQREGYVRDVVAGYMALTAVLSNVDAASGQRETITVTTIQLANQQVLCLIGVSPERDASLYADVFRRIRQTLRFTNTPAPTPAPAAPSSAAPGSSPNGAGTAGEYAGPYFRFSYPSAWRVTRDGVDPSNPRFVIVALEPRAGSNEVIHVRYRIARDQQGTDDMALYDFGKTFCGRDTLSQGDVPTPQVAGDGFAVRSFVVRSLSTSRECLDSAVFRTPAARPYLSSNLVHVLYAHDSSRPRAQSFLSEIGGGDVRAYLESLDSWNRVVNSFRFTTDGAAPEAPVLSAQTGNNHPLAGSWNGRRPTNGYVWEFRFDLDFKADGTYAYTVRQTSPQKPFWTLQHTGRFNYLKTDANGWDAIIELVPDRGSAAPPTPADRTALFDILGLPDERSHQFRYKRSMTGSTSIQVQPVDADPSDSIDQTWSLNRPGGR